MARSDRSVNPEHSATRGARRTFRTLRWLAVVLVASSPPVWGADFTVELTASGTELTNPRSVERDDGFPDLSARGGLVSGRPCAEDRKTVCVPDGCVLDTSRTYSTTTHLGGGFGRGGAGYGILVWSVNDPGREGSASHRMDYQTGCLTSTVKVCAKRRQRGWYKADHVLYLQCGAREEWRNTVTRPAPGGTFTITAADGYRHLATYDGPIGSGNGTDVTVTRYDARVSTRSPANADITVGMFAADPTTSAENGPQLWARNTANNDLSVAAIEVTQGMQNLANEMPLVSERRTIVRSYVRSLVSVGSVQARLRGFRNGVELPGSPLDPEAPINAGTDGGDRLRLDHGFVFHLPPAWRQSGELVLRLDVDHDDTVPEIDETNNSQEVTVRLHPSSDLHLATVPFHLHPEGDRERPVLTYETSDGTFWPITANLLRHHPIGRLLLWDCGIEPQKPTFHSWPIQQEWNMASGLGQTLVLSRVMWVRALSGCGVPNQHWVGLIHPDLSTTTGNGTTLGIAVPGGRSSWVKMDGGRDPWSPWRIEGGATLAHEIGHNRLLPHVRCTGAEGFPVTDLYPYPAPDCRLAEGLDGYFGLDVYHAVWGLPEPTVIDNDPTAPAPHAAFPLMGYRGPEWISPFSYCALLVGSGVPCNPLGIRTGLPPAEPTSAASAPAVQRRRSAAHLLVGGVVEGFTGRVEELTVRRVQELPPSLAIAEAEPRRLPDPDALWSLAQIGDDGRLLASVPIDVELSDGADGLGAFVVGIPAEPGARRLEIRHLGRVAATREASAHEPTIHLLEPHEGDLRGRVTVRWWADDADRDPLTFSVYFSPDDGQTWRLIALDLSERIYQVDSLRRLPGTDRGRFRVVAHDGFHTAIDESESRLTAPGSRPTVSILERDGLEIGVGQTLQLTGVATDVEDGPITRGRVFSWRSDRDGLVGRGTELFTRSLSRGVHHLTLTVSDSDGARGSAERIVFVGVDRPSGTWTAWLDRDGPSGLGDFETLADFVRAGQACPHPLGVECRTVREGTDWSETGQAYRCDPSTGGVCRNDLQGDGDRCADYEVRFLCLTPAGT